MTGFYNKKVEFSESVLKGLWCYLDDLLHSKKLHSLLSQGKNITLKLNVKQVPLIHAYTTCMHGMYTNCEMIVENVIYNVNAIAISTTFLLQLSELLWISTPRMNSIYIYLD